jgi:hypothetical protein
VSYHRREVGAEPEARVERLSYDAAGRLGGQWVRACGPVAGWRAGALTGTLYDELLHPVNVHEQMGDAPQRCVERLTYGDATQGATNRPAAARLPPMECRVWGRHKPSSPLHIGHRELARVDASARCVTRHR